MHPALAPMIERNAYIGGADGVAVALSGEAIGEKAMGTMPHALILCMGGTVPAVKAYDELMPPELMRVALIDTFEDEKFACLNVAQEMGKKLAAVRFDTPSSRRGNFYRILEECRWELDRRGFGHIKFFVSGGIKEKDVPGLNPLVDGYGIGTSISAAPVVDYAMDIMEIEGEALAKRGKWSGSKRVLVCPRCRERLIAPNDARSHKCRCGGASVDVLVSVFENGAYLLPAENPRTVRERTLAETGGRPL
jgi:nicotinate phosphoribosyltransferase